MPVFAVDPGETVGWANFLDNGKLDSGSEMPSEQFLWVLAAFNKGDIDRIVCEDYRLWAGTGNTHTGSRFETVQIIGALRLLARQLMVPFVLQSPQILKPTAMHYGFSVPRGHIPDWMSARLHGLRYFEESGVSTERLRQVNAGGTLKEPPIQ